MGSSDRPAARDRTRSTAPRTIDTSPLEGGVRAGSASRIASRSPSRCRSIGVARSESTGAAASSTRAYNRRTAAGWARCQAMKTTSGCRGTAVVSNVISNPSIDRSSARMRRVRCCQFDGSRLVSRTVSGTGYKHGSPSTTEHRTKRPPYLLGTRAYVGPTQSINHCSGSQRSIRRIHLIRHVRRLQDVSK